MNATRFLRMQDVARAAGVSRATVCYALRNDQQLPVATRRRIQRIARKLGYRTNPLVSALMANLRASKKRDHPLTIAYVTDCFSNVAQLRTHAYHRGIFEGAFGRAEQAGFRVEPFFISDGGLTPRRLSEVLYTRHIGGLLLAPMSGRLRTLAFRWDWFSCASIGIPMPDRAQAGGERLRLHVAEAHHYNAMQMARHEMHGLGYRRVGLVMQEMWDLRLDDAWTASYTAYEKRIYARPPIPCLRPEMITEQAFHAWFKRYRPDAIITHDGRIIAWLETRGMRVPCDVGICHMGIPPGDEFYSGLYQNPELIAAAAVDLIIEQMYHNETGLPAQPRVLLIGSTWMMRKTLRQKAVAGTAVPMGA
ncbi:MAG: LacI family DNA-binding transcriptional regulator [Verrucomicrobia bacterium]|nr:LacI family DNA-binding transcriptional regulator [Verrucomicrobiota bacterium]